jgi:transcriptional regulator GlxA family with amidase domain
LTVDFLPPRWEDHRVAPPLTSVAVLVLPGTAPFELGVACEVFGIDRSEEGLPVPAFAVVTPVPGRVPTSAGFALEVPLGLEAATGADLVVVPASPLDAEVAPEALDLLRATVARGARVLSECSGAFVLGRAGLLDGRRCTTHWRHAAELARRFPLARVDPDVLYVDEGAVVTSAGTAAGVDACLHVVRQSWGAAAATAVARRMVVPPHRDGGQAQYVAAPVPVCTDDDLAPVLAELAGSLDREHTVATMAQRALMSPRTFARRFAGATGTSPAAWLARQRLHRAQELLEGTDLSVEEVARAVGWGSAAVLRHHFAALGTSPRAYRRTFAGRAPAAAPAPAASATS